MITLAMLVMLLMPPERFDHYPTRPFTVIEVTDNKFIDALCGKEGKRIIACTIGDNIYLRNDFTKDAKKKILRHEYAHLNGWHHE